MEAQRVYQLPGQGAACPLLSYHCRRKTRKENIVPLKKVEFCLEMVFRRWQRELTVVSSYQQKMEGEKTYMYSYYYAI